MDDLEKRQTEMLGKINNFGEENEAVIKANNKAMAAFVVVKTSVVQLEEVGAERTSSTETKIGSSAQKKNLRDALNKKVMNIIQIARQIALDNSDFNNKFRSPSKTFNDKTLLETARAFLNDLPAAAQNFLDYAVPADFIEKLAADTEAFAEIINTQDVSKRGAVGANALIDNIIKTALKSRKILMTIIPNLFRDNPGKLAEWIAASTIQKAAKTSKPENETP